MLAAAVITALPMFGDYYTADLLSGAPRTSMIGNQIQFFLLEQLREGDRRGVSSSCSRCCCSLLMAYYLVTTDHAATRAAQ